MLKNRDTASNPYRVPPQPSPIWLKVTILLLCSLLLVTMGAVAYLMIFRLECPCQGEKSASSDKVLIKSREMADQVPPDGDVQKEKQFRDLYLKFNRIDKELTTTKIELSRLDSMCKKIKQRGIKPLNGGTTSQSISFTEKTLLQKIPEIESYAQGLNQKLVDHIEQRKKVCRRNHWRHGVRCYSVADASVDQGAAKQWCQDDYGGQASLAIVKDRFTQDFISGKLVDRSQSYWIGIEQPTIASKELPMTSHILAADPGIEPSSTRSKFPFVYSDGTKVQRNVWNMWAPKQSTESRERAARCVAITFDNMTSQWRWKERSCSDTLGYICQYYIMSDIEGTSSG